VSVAQGKNAFQIWAGAEKGNLSEAKKKHGSREGEHSHLTVKSGEVRGGERGYWKCSIRYFPSAKGRRGVEKKKEAAGK